MDERLKFDVLKLAFETMRDNRMPGGFGQMYTPPVNYVDLLKLAKEYLTFIKEN
jgi:hypothetical protein